MSQAGEKTAHAVGQALESIIGAICYPAMYPNALDIELDSALELGAPNPCPFWPSW